MKRRMIPLLAAGLIAGPAMLAPLAASAHTSISLGFNLGALLAPPVVGYGYGYAPPVAYAPAPVVGYAPPVTYAPPPVRYVAPPVAYGYAPPVVTYAPPVVYAPAPAYYGPRVRFGGVFHWGGHRGWR